jgi:hypothetical protein
MKPRAESTDRSRGTLRVQHGFSLLEVAFAVTLIFALTVLIVSSLSQLSRTQAHTRGQAHVAAVGDAIVRLIETDAALACRLFGDDAESTQFFQRLELDHAAVLADSRRPRHCDRGYFDQDPPTQVETGNLLFVVRDAGTHLADLAVSGPPDLVRIDLCRFVVYHLFTGPLGLDLRRWASVPFALRSDLLSINDPNRRASTGQKLLQAGIQHALDVDRPVGQALWRIDAGGEMVPFAPTERILPQPEECRDSLLAARRVAIARNGAIAGTPVPRYAKPLRSFPSGFEIKWDGPGTGRLVLLRLVLQYDEGRGRPNHIEVARLVNQ